MIYVERERIDEDGETIAPRGTWSDRAAAHRRELEDAFDRGEDPQVSDSLYKDDAVKTALEELFHGKCAYCETAIGTRSSWDVEHYRPKGRVAERNGSDGRPAHPGYYWLSVHWHNLYPSCQACNQRRRDPATWDEPTAGSSAGKLDQFPLWDEDARAMSHHEAHDDETPMLLDPCWDDPEVYLTYDVTGTVLPREGAAVHEYARRSIEILHLNARRLREERRERIALVADLLHDARTLEDLQQPEGAAMARAYAARWVRDECDHAGVARDVHRDPAAFGVS